MGGELKGASGGMDPPDAAPHRRCLKHLKQELEQSLLPLSYQGGRGCKYKYDVTMIHTCTVCMSVTCMLFSTTMGFTPNT